MNKASSSAPEDFSSKIEFYFTGFLTRKKSLLCRFLFNRYIARVTIAKEYVDELSELSRRGLLVFAQKNKSQLNCLILRDILAQTFQGELFCHGINMTLWQPFSTNLRILVSRVLGVLSGRKKAHHGPLPLNEIDRRGAFGVIYLRGSEFLSFKPAQDPIAQLIEVGNHFSRPIYIVPVLVSYGWRREKSQRTFIEILLGMKENPGPFRRTYTFLRHSKKGRVLCSRPVDLAEILDRYKGKSLETASYHIRRELIERIDSEKRAIFGPVLKSRDELMETVLRDTYMVKSMEAMTVNGSKNFKAFTREAKKYLNEIAADFNEIYIEIFYKLLTWLWNNIYDGIIVDQRDLDRIKEISKKMPFVIIPCHRSHMDYLLLHYVMEDHSIQLPFVAAGEHLGFWPLGPIARKCGAFFIRQRFQEGDFYHAVLSKYIKVLLKEGFPIEFFIEGGRSRTGKMVLPKYDILSMVLQAYQEGISDDVALIPIYIGYDKIIEEKSYLQEIGGEAKQPEKVADLLKTSSILRRRYGSVYVNIAEPMLLKSYLSPLEKTYEELDAVERQNLYRRIGYEIVSAINQVSVVTPFSLMACCLLSHYRRGIAQNELNRIYDLFCDWLVGNRVKLASTFSSRERAMADALALFEQSKLLDLMGVEEEDREDEIEEIVYSVPEDKRLNLEYYKNNILHFFLPLSFVAASILSRNADRVSFEHILSDYGFFKKIFSNEFIFNQSREDANEIEEALDYLKRKGILRENREDVPASVEVRSHRRTDLQPFAGLIHNYIESYWVVVRGCSYLKKESRTERNFEKKVQLLGTRMFKKGEISRLEALSVPNYNNAMKFLSDEGYLALQAIKGKKDREMRFYVLTADRGRMEVLRQRLFRFL